MPGPGSGTPGSWGNRGGWGRWGGGGFNRRTVNVFDYGYVWPMQPIVAIETPAAEPTAKEAPKRTDTSLTGGMFILAVAVFGFAIYKIVKS